MNTKKQLKVLENAEAILVGKKYLKSYGEKDSEDSSSRWESEDRPLKLGLGANWYA